MAPVSQTYGALLIGGLLAMYFSGIVCIQCLLYFRTFRDDRLRIKLKVLAVWALDILHSVFVSVSLWQYLILGLNDITIIQEILWPVSATIAITGVTTFIIQCFLAHRVWTLSKHNIWITCIIVTLAFLRMLSAFGAVIQMSLLDTWARFHAVAAWNFTTGLAISACADLLIAISIVYYLNRNRTGFERHFLRIRSDYIIDTIVLYTIENGLLTSVSVVASLICWLTMPTNLIFLALHFVISKMYANSLLATLNARKFIKQESSRSGSRRRGSSIRLPTFLTSASSRLTQTTRSEFAPQTPLQINVEKSVHCVTDIGSRTVAVDINSMDPMLTLSEASPTSHESRDAGMLSSGKD
ncbi:hypothetical protein BDY19DRAFT_995989 [Irpex rosettiformis]|uniref:Uncharacterized protein n=1 Tax=Irpex rosettiformis TaxID=378272 RepID=A0ACB8TWC8_9APHY|nr:hypothetical protein BDY19DRAFT_995989 [Irpex rosettiformis]